MDYPKWADYTADVQFALISAAETGFYRHSPDYPTVNPRPVAIQMVALGLFESVSENVWKLTWKGRAAWTDRPHGIDTDYQKQVIDSLKTIIEQALAAEQALYEGKEGQGGYDWLKGRSEGWNEAATIAASALSILESNDLW